MVVHKSILVLSARMPVRNITCFTAQQVDWYHSRTNPETETLWLFPGHEEATASNAPSTSLNPEPSP